VIHSFRCRVRHQDRFGARRLNETWFKATKEGMFYGQCSELCARPRLHADRGAVVNIRNSQLGRSAKKKFAANPSTRSLPPARRRSKQPRGTKPRATGPQGSKDLQD